MGGRFKFPVAGKSQLYSCCCNNPPPDPCHVFKGNSNQSYTVTLPAVSVFVDQTNGGDEPDYNICAGIEHWTFALAAGYIVEAQACTQGTIGTDGCPAKNCTPDTPPYTGWNFIDTIPGTYTTENCGPGGYYCSNPPSNCCVYPDCAGWAKAPDACLHANISLSVACFVNQDPSNGPVGVAMAGWTCTVGFSITSCGQAYSAAFNNNMDEGPCCWEQSVTSNGMNEASFTFTGVGTINADGSANLPSKWTGGGTAALGWCASCAAGCPIQTPPPCSQYGAANAFTLGSISVS